MRAGLDLTLLDRDALRERQIVATSMVFYDHLWPDVSQDDLDRGIDILAEAIKAYEG